MAKKVKGDLEIENSAIIDNELTLTAETNSRALELDGSGKVKSSTVTSTELAHLSGVTSGIQSQLDAKQETSEKGNANGYASLDGSGKVPAGQLPNSVMDYLGSWNASTNSPTLIDGTGNAGDVYRASVAGSQDLGSGSETWGVGDLVIYSGTIWEKAPAGDLVASVHGRTGVVVSATSDYDAVQIDYDNATSGMTATNTQAAIDEVEGRVDALETDNVVTTQGDLIVGNVGGNPARLPIGANGTVLKSNGTTASWDTDTNTDELVKVSADDTTAKYLEDAITVSQGSNTTNILEVSTTTPGGDEDVQIQIDEAKITHDNLNGFVGNEHIDHSGVNINTNADSGLTGGGDITTSRTLSININGTTAETTVAGNDEILIYDITAGALRKMTRDNFVGTPGASSGDISETSFGGANNQSTPANVTGFAFANGTVRSFKAHGSIVVDATADLYEEFEIHGIQRGADWVISEARTGDTSQVEFTITTAGQIQYTSANYAGFVSLNIKFRAITTSV